MNSIGWLVDGNNKSLLVHVGSRSTKLRSLVIHFYKLVFLVFFKRGAEICKLLPDAGIDSTDSCGMSCAPLGVINLITQIFRGVHALMQASILQTLVSELF